MGYFSYRRYFLISVLIFTAAAALAGCGAEPPPQAVVSLSTPRLQSNRWDTPYGPGQELVSRHYRIYTTVRRSRLLAVLPGFLEAAHDSYLHILKMEDRSSELMPVYMMGTRAEWAGLTQSRFGRGASPATIIEDGGYTFNGITVCWDIGGMGTLAVASHEGMHQFLFYNLKNRLPLWAEEGLATTAEGFVLTRESVRFMPDNNVIRLSDMRGAIVKDHWLPLEKLLTTNTVRVARGGTIKTVGYYGQLYALMCFLRHSETYNPGWAAMFADAQAGRFSRVLSPAQLRLRGLRYHQVVSLPLFEFYITKDLPAFDAEFRKYARRLVKLPPDPMTTR